MDLSRFTCCIAVLVVCLFLPRMCAPAGDQLAVGELLSPGQTVVSDRGAFALGFFSPSNSTPGRQYLGIWYNSIPGRTVVWVANRDAPATDRSSSSPAGSPTLALTNGSNLVLSDADGRVLWTTGVAGSGSSSLPQPALLTNAGNLVLRSRNGTTLWQSFDHPTDTFIPGMKVRLNYRTREAGRIVSWKDPGDPAPGSFSYGMDPGTSLQLLMWNGTRPYWRTPVWRGYTVTSNYLSAGTVVYTAVVDTEEEISTTFSVSDEASPTRYVLTSFGRFQLLSWNSSSSAWAVLGQWPAWKCNRYGYCGPYGYCDVTTALAATCRCLDGFEPASTVDWINGRFAQGCRRKEALAPCNGDGGGGGDGFLAMPSMKVPDRFLLDAGNRSAEECAARCAANCSCVAYAYANLRSSSAKGNVKRCLAWVGELVDTQMIGSRWGAAGETLYLRVPASSTVIAVSPVAAAVPLPPPSCTSRSDCHAALAAQATQEGGDGDGQIQSTRRKESKNAVKIVLPVLAGVLMLTCIFFVWFCRFRGKGRITESQQKLVPGSVNTSSEIGEGNQTEDLEFPHIRFIDIVAVTDNFSKTFLIGHGGFGKVYKGTLDSGQEVAVKRLSKDSDQGAEEFKNEAILIAKLQHRNLVRLLGCCTEGAEKLLIYEYLANKGLDAILFDSARKSLLDWPTRFGIIKGVARGLLYLHQDSRLTVIHRDLKASNVLLDSEMRPKIADFGMAKIFCENQQNANTKRVVGTFGYIAPEYSTEGIFSVKSDVYSFGVLVLEVVSGVRVSSTEDIMEFPSLVFYAWNLWKEGKASNLVDSSMAESCSPDEVSLCIHVGLLCVADDPGSRPLMSSVVSILENGSASSSSLATPNQPAYFAQMQLKRDDLENSENTRNTMTMTVIQGR